MILYLRAPVKRNLMSFGGKCSALVAMGLRHRTVIQRLLERLLIDAGFAGHVTKRAARGSGFLHDLRGLVVANVRVESRRG